jgi:tripartite-type tricarboxylate transporter receptor subunit TctC
VLSAHRIPDLPDVPTMSEAGYPSVISASWTGLFAPAGTNPAVVHKLNEAINSGLHTPATEEALARLGNVPLGGTPEDLTNLIVAEIGKWTPIVQSLHMTPQ